MGRASVGLLNAHTVEAASPVVVPDDPVHGGTVADGHPTVVTARGTSDGQGPLHPPFPKVGTSPSSPPVEVSEEG